MVITGRLSLRDDKEPQIGINRARPMSDFAQEEPEPEVPVRRAPEIAVRGDGTLYLRLPGEDAVLYPKVKAILNMFPGDSTAVLFFEDTRQRRGTRVSLADIMLRELENVLGPGNVVIK